MAEGQKAAENTKSAFHQAGVRYISLNSEFMSLTTLQQTSESLRENVNSFADNLLGGNKQHESTGIHPDAKKTGEGAVEGAGAVVGKVEKAVDKNKRA